MHLIDNINYLQLKQGKKKARGRRYSIKDKLLAIILHRQTGPSGYKILQLFALPSKKTLQALLNRIKIKPGIKEAIFSNLKMIGERMSRINKICVLSFDEIALSSNVHFNMSEDSFEGFEDFGDKRTTKICDHSSVFL